MRLITGLAVSKPLNDWLKSFRKLAVVQEQVMTGFLTNDQRIDRAICAEGDPAVGVFVASAFLVQF